MTSYFLIQPEKISLRLDRMVQEIVQAIGLPQRIINDEDNLPDLRNQKLIFAIEVDNTGNNASLYTILSRLYDRGKDALAGASGFIIVSSSGDFFTKSVAQNIIFLTNNLGCRFMGHPLIEITAGCQNFLTWQKSLKMPLEDIAIELCRRYGKRFVDDNPVIVKEPKLLVLHASSRETSNTVMFWDMIKANLSTDYQVEEINVDKGMVLDCRGCAYKECLHYSRQSGCYYGGVVIKDLFPAIERVDALVWLCPNYNDAISANLMAVINRMTALYRKTSFYSKTLFSVIVSGNSGSDSVAKQLIGALNINKGFRLPPYFAVTATANDPGEISKVSLIQKKAKLFAQNIMREIRA